eukprot:scaffold135676_cov16-Tisochrysis_lutea.AAC.1
MSRIATKYKCDCMVKLGGQFVDLQASCGCLAWQGYWKGRFGGLWGSASNLHIPSKKKTFLPPAQQKNLAHQHVDWRACIHACVR